MVTNAFRLMGETQPGVRGRMLATGWRPVTNAFRLMGETQQSTPETEPTPEAPAVTNAFRLMGETQHCAFRLMPIGTAKGHQCLSADGGNPTPSPGPEALA